MATIEIKETLHPDTPIPVARLPRDAVDSVATLEAMGRDVVWDAVREQLDVIVGGAAPFVKTPSRQVEITSADQLLPVVGPSTSALVECAGLFAKQEETVLITGPTGVGKSRLARWCHAQSRRAAYRFETLDLPSVPEDLQMAELFGWKRGAFTGAVKDSSGAIARAAGGTLFIDEIDKLSLKAQAGLLRVLEDRCFRPLGDESSDRRADVRFIVSTNTDLRAAVRARRFREDLYYRIHVLPLKLPALADRLDEIPMWADYMLNRRHREASRAEEAQLSPEAIQQLLATPWPGNLRQLDNVLRRAYTFALLDHRGDHAPLLLDRHHITSALAYEDTTEVGSTIKHLWRAALAFVAEAERRGSGTTPLSLDLCEAFRGLVLGVAVQRFSSRDQAFIMLGQQQLLKNRNHHRAFRRELDRARELVRILGTDVDPDLAALLDADDPISGPGSGA